MKIQSLKPLAIALMLAIVAPLFVSTVYAHSPPPLGGVNKFAYKIGDTGPGGGIIFFVDYYDQYTSFTYLEAAPKDIGLYIWCDTYIPNPVSGAAQWAAKGVGKGQANTNAMIAAGCSGAAVAADQYVNGRKSDWFLPSLGEAKLMYDNLIEAGKAGVDGFPWGAYWSSTNLGFGLAFMQSFNDGLQGNSNVNQTLAVLPIRSFR